MQRRNASQSSGGYVSQKALKETPASEPSMRRWGTSHRQNAFWKVAFMLGMLWTIRVLFRIGSPVPGARRPNRHWSNRLTHTPCLPQRSMRACRCHESAVSGCSSKKNRPTRIWKRAISTANNRRRSATKRRDWYFASPILSRHHSRIRAENKVQGGLRTATSGWTVSRWCHTAARPLTVPRSISESSLKSKLLPPSKPNAPQRSTSRGRLNNSHTSTRETGSSGTTSIISTSSSEVELAMLEDKLQNSERLLGTKASRFMFHIQGNISTCSTWNRTSH